MLRKDQDSIKVYTCNTEGVKFKSVKASFTINSTLSILASFITDIDGYDDWQYNTIRPRIVKRISDHELIYYTEIDAPWPVSNRDMVVDLVLVQDPKTRSVTIRTTSVPTFIPDEKGIVRVPMSRATWTIIPVGATKLSVEYAIQIDPGGSVPAWMVNMVCAEAPYTSFKNLRKKIHTYKNKTLLFIKD